MFIILLNTVDFNPSSEFNESFINETQITSFNIGVVVASQSILNERLLPVYNITDGKVEEIGYYNLTECIKE